MPNYTLHTRKELIKITIKANNAFIQRNPLNIVKTEIFLCLLKKKSYMIVNNLFNVLAVEAVQNDMKTLYACQGDTLDLTCPVGYVIKVMRANYGRFSVGICNEHGITDWSVNCMAPRSLRILQDR